MYKPALFTSSRKLKNALAAVIALATAAPAFSADIIQIFSESTVTPGGTVIRSVETGGKSIPNLVESLINRTDQFAVYGNDRFVSAGLSALGVDHVLFLDVADNSGVSGPVNVRITSPLTGLDRTFSGATRADAEAQVKDFLKKDGAAELAKILNALSKTSSLAVTTGNPNSSAALTAQGVFDQYGFIEPRTNGEVEDGLAPTYEVALRGDMGFIESKGYKAQSYSLPIGFSIIERERWGLRFQMPLNYTEIEGAQIFRAGANLALPIMVIGSTAEHKTPWYWQVTPSGGSQVTASFDLLAGGVMNNVGLTSALEYNLGTNFHNIRVCMGNQVTAIESMQVDVGEYSFDPKVSNRIFKNGLKVSMPFGRRWVADLYVIDTRFTGDPTYSSSYETVGGSLGYRKGRKGGFYKVGTYANIAKDYTSANVHFGAGWAF